MDWNTDRIRPYGAVVYGPGSGGGHSGGAMPGINASITTALLLPFTYSMEPTQALMLLTGVYIGVNYGGSIPAS